MDEPNPIFRRHHHAFTMTIAIEESYVGEANAKSRTHPAFKRACVRVLKRAADVLEEVDHDRYTLKTVELVPVLAFQDETIQLTLTFHDNHPRFPPDRITKR